MQSMKSIDERDNHISSRANFELLTKMEISLIFNLAFLAYSEFLYFSISADLISAVAKFIKGSDVTCVACHLTR